MKILDILKNEFNAILTNKAIILTLFGGVLFYSFLYPQPYINENPTNQKVVLIDQDRSNLSLKFARLLNSTSQISILRSVSSVKQAQEMIEKNEAQGFVLIPQNFQKDIINNALPSISYGANASYFLVYGTIAQAIMQVSSKIIQEYQKKPNLEHLKLELKPLFNPTTSYIVYIIPAIFVLLIHQILIICVGIQGANEKETGIFYPKHISLLKIFIARLGAYLVLMLPLGMYLFGFCFDLYGIPHHNSLFVMLFLLVVLILSASSLGIFLGAIIPRRELVTFFVLISSIALIFTAGFVWPWDLMPKWVLFIANLFASTHLIKAFILSNQMGLDFMQIMPFILKSLALMVAYLFCAAFVMKQR